LKKYFILKKYFNDIQRILFYFILKNVQNLMWKKAGNDSFGE